MRCLRCSLCASAAVAFRSAADPLPRPRQPPVPAPRPESAGERGVPAAAPEAMAAAGGLREATEEAVR